MDVNRLIVEVHKRPELWNQKNLAYHNRDVTNQIWMEIAAIFKVPKQALKNKWKGLRDTFRTEMKKEMAYRKSNFTTERQQWYHFKSLQFLQEQMVPKPPIWEREKDSRDYEDATSAEVEPKKRREIPVDGIVNAIGDNAPVKKNLPEPQKHEQQLEIRHEFPVVRDKAPGIDAAADNRGDFPKDDVSNAISPRNLRSTDKNSRKKRNNFYNCNYKNNNYYNNRNTKKSSRVGGENEAENEECEVKLEPADDYEIRVNDTENVAERMNDFDDDGLRMDGTTNEDMLVAETAVGENFLGSGQINADPLEGNCFDDNYYFLMSLLPHIRTLSAERCMLLRMQMQQIVYQEVYGKTRLSGTKCASSHSQDQRP